MQLTSLLQSRLVPSPKKRYSPSGEESASHEEEAVLQIMTRCNSTQVGTQCRNQRSHDHRDKFFRTYCLSNFSIVSDLIRHQILIQFHVVLNKQPLRFIALKTLARTFGLLKLYTNQLVVCFSLRV